MFQDSTGRLWLGLKGAGLYVKKDDILEFEQPDFLKPFHPVFS